MKEFKKLGPYESEPVKASKAEIRIAEYYRYKISSWEMTQEEANKKLSNLIL